MARKQLRTCVIKDKSQDTTQHSEPQGASHINQSPGISQPQGSQDHDDLDIESKEVEVHITGIIYNHAYVCTLFD